jgi:LysM repeat protein
MVQRVPAHLGETTNDSLPPWVVIGGIVVLAIVLGIVAFILLGGPARLGFGGAAVTATPTRTPRAVTPIVTVILATPSSPTQTLGPTPVTTKYRVKPGDSLIEIAARYKVSVQAIKNANNLKDDTIRVGDELIIPLSTPTPPPGANPSPAPVGTPTPLSFQSPPTSATSAGSAGVIRHVVQRGDTLITIAASYGSSVDAIRIANQLDSDFLSIGQVLLVPVGAWSPTPSPAPVVNTSVIPTALFSYAAPNLMGPPNNQTFHGSRDVPTLEWLSVGTLKPNEFYALHIDYTWNGENKSIVRQIKQGTSIKLEATDYPGANTNGTPFVWYVMIVSQTITGAHVPSPATQTFAASPPSVTRTFVWY